MAIPNNALSSEVRSAAFLSPDNQVSSLTKDYERGGVAIDDGTQGMLVRDWWAEIVGDDIVIANSDGPQQTLSKPGTTEVSLSFDRNMRVALAWVQGGEKYLRWFDPVANAMVETTLDAGIQNPRLCYDDKRVTQESASDVILAYIRSGNLYFRQQRDRYTVERLLGPVPATYLLNIGMNRGNRLQFQFVDVL